MSDIIWIDFTLEELQELYKSKKFSGATEAGRRIITTMFVKMQELDRKKQTNKNLEQEAEHQKKYGCISLTDWKLKKIRQQQRF